MNIKSRVEAAISSTIKKSNRIFGGYTPAERWLVEFSGGQRFFLKIGTTEDTSRWLRDEHQNYLKIKGLFLPKLIAWLDDETRPILILEDLSVYRWPKSWDSESVSQVIESLAQLHSTKVALRTFAEVHPNLGGNWKDVAENPKSFLSLGLVSDEWLKLALPLLLNAESKVKTEGECPIHFDVRSDNICLTNRGAVLVDWNLSCLGNRKLDIGFWLPSLAAEGGPLPETILPDSPEIAAWVCGFFAARAGLPIIPQAPRVREIQLVQLRPALDWAVRALKLPPIH